MVGHYVRPTMISGGSRGEGARGAHPPEMKPPLHSLLKFVYFTSQSRCFLVVHPLLQKSWIRPLHIATHMVALRPLEKWWK